MQLIHGSRFPTVQMTSVAGERNQVSHGRVAKSCATLPVGAVDSKSCATTPRSPHHTLHTTPSDHDGAATVRERYYRTSKTRHFK
jgi:hypothetical protein